MTAPGLSSERIPLQVRLYLALAVTLALAPALFERLSPSLAHPELLSMAATLLYELIIGVALGLLARMYFLALETLSTSVAMTFGLGNIFGPAITEPEPAPALSSFIVFCAVTLVFVTDQHLEFVKALYVSYETAPVHAPPSPAALLDEMTRLLTQSHLLALRICSPFLLFGIVVNLGLGLLARLTPQVQIYFVSGPIVILMGIYAFSLLAHDFFTAFSGHFGAWLLRG